MTNINTTIRDYRELQQQIKIATNNQKELNEALKKTTPGKEFGKYKRQLEEVEFELKSLQTQAEDVAYALSKELGDDAFNSLLDGGKTLEAELRNITNTMKLMALAGQQDSEAFRTLQAEAIEIKNSIISVNKEINTLSGTTGINTISDQFKNLGASILTLNFEGATKQATTLTTALNSISWSSTITGVKNLTSAFSSLGKALLTNPIFLIGTIIVGIGAAIYKLMKETGLLQVAMEALGKVFELMMKPINMLINGLKSLTDWLGLTNNAQQELAATELKNSNERLKSFKTLYDQQQADIENNIYLKKQELAQIKDTDEGALESKLAIQTEINRLNAEAIANQDLLAQKELENNEKVKNDALAKYKTIEKWEKEDLVSFQKYSDKRTEIIAKRTQLQFDYYTKSAIEAENAINEIRNKATEDEKKALKERQEAHKAYVLNRLEAERMINDLALNLLDEGIEKEIAKEREAYKRLKEDTLRNEKITAEERSTILLLLEETHYKNLRDLRIKNAKSIDAEVAKMQKELDDKNAKQAEDQSKKRADAMAKLEEHQKRIVRLNMSESEVAIEELKDYYETLWKETASLYSSTEEAMIAYYKLQGELASEIEKLTISDSFISKHTSDINALTEALQNASGEYGHFFNDVAQVIAQAALEFDEIFNTTFETTTEKVAAMTTAIGSVISGVLSSISAELNRQLEMDLNTLNGSITERMAELDNQLANQIINQETYNREKQLLEAESNKKENEIRKKAFDENKKMQIANATIQMLQGAVSAFSGAMQLGPIAGPIVGGILAAAVLAMGSSNISRIKATQFEGSTGNASTGLSSTSISTPKTETMNTPQFIFQGSGNNANTQNLSQPNNQNVNVTVDVNLDVNEITNAQNSIINTQSYVELGG